MYVPLLAYLGMHMLVNIYSTQTHTRTHTTHTHTYTHTHTHTHTHTNTHTHTHTHTLTHTYTHTHTHTLTHSHTHTHTHTHIHTHTHTHTHTRTHTNSSVTSSQPAPRCCAFTDAGGGGDDVDVADSVQLAVGSFTQPAHYWDTGALHTRSFPSGSHDSHVMFHLHKC